MQFKMSIKSNFYQVKDLEAKITYCVDSFDNIEFTAWATDRKGNKISSHNFTAKNSKQLNATLSKLFNKSAIA
ncbi:hypothetical protein ACUXVY_12795 [Chromobacterium haemolyticum]|uniref:hypothetical protein n=1 Tax=Chromobacterium haemolyticum TaxID=394935 RepID=UPI004055DB0F